MKARFVLSLAVGMTMGCQLITPTGMANRPKPRPAASTAAAVSGPRVVDPADLQANAPLKLSGLARILSDNGLGIISNNGGAIISNNGAGIISDNGLGYRVMAGTARPESLLADATIEVLDAQGRVLVNKANQPLTATTDKQGRYVLSGVVPRENLVLRIKLWNGGVLQAILATAGGGHEVSTAPAEDEALAVDLNTASSLGATYVMEQLVKQRQGVFNLLPRNEAEGLTRALEAARGGLTGTPSYQPADLIKAAADLRAQAKAVDDSLTRIEAILLAGQADVGNGLPATQVPLAAANAVTGDAAGNLYIAETATRRIRKVNAEGIISQLALKGEPLGNPTALVRAKDGTMYAACPVQYKVYKIAPDGTVSTYAGTGERHDGEPAGGAATRCPMTWPTQLALAPDGRLYIGEVTKQSEKRKTRILYVTPDGRMHQVPTTDDLWLYSPPGVPYAPSVGGMAVGPDGTLYTGIRWGVKLAGWTESGGWKVIASDFKGRDYAGMAVAPDGTIYAVGSEEHVVWAYAPDGTRKRLAGQQNMAGAEGDNGPATAAKLTEPNGLHLAADGTLYVADAGNGLVRSIDKAGVIRTVAGATGVSQQGDVASIGLNAPSGLANDTQGRLIMAESGTAAIKRLDGQTLTLLVGSTKIKPGEPNGDGGPAAQAKLVGPGHLASFGEELYFMDNGDLKLRKVDKDGIVRTVAGKGLNHNFTFTPSFKADSDFLVLPSGLAISPAGVPHFADARNMHIYKLEGDHVTVVAGALGIETGESGDGGPAVKAKLNRPSALAFDPDGTLYVADSANLVVRKITKDGTISRVAGLGLAASMTKLFGFTPGADEGAKALSSMFVVPMSLAVDAAGNLYVGEAGTSNVDLLGDKIPVPAALIPKIGARVRKIAKDGTVTTVAGPGGKALSDGELLMPLGLLIDKQGRLIISDGVSNQVWMLPKGSF